MIMRRLGFLGLMCLSLSLFATVTVTIQPQPAHVNQELNLVIRQQGFQVSNHLPDLSALSSHFDILGTQQSMAYQNYNGQVQHENIWTVVLLPKHPGKFTLPSLNLAGEASSAQTIEVLPERAASLAPVKPGARVFMQWRIEPREAVLRQQMNIKVEIFHSMPLLDAKLSSPQVENALLFNLDGAGHRIEVIKGERYEVETYQYLLFPQKTGELKIQPPSLDALEYDFVPNPVHIRLPARTLNIGPIDVQALKKLSVKMLKSPSSSTNIPLGDTFTREFELEAQGLPYQMMPEFKVSCGQDCKVYVQNTEHENVIKNGDVFGRKRFSVSYLPQKSGAMLVKDIEIPWLNTQTQAREQLTIPGLRLEIAAPAISMPQEALTPVKAFPSDKTGKIPSWALMLMGLIFGMGLMQVWKIISWAKWGPWLRKFIFERSPIKRACLKNDAQALRMNLLVWAKKHFPQEKIYDLHDLLPLVTELDFKAVLNELIEYLYGNHPQQKTWDGSRFWVVFNQLGHRKKNKFKEKNLVNGLNPH